jgi:O-antigen/teichoic acid export membrane protein
MLKNPVHSVTSLSKQSLLYGIGILGRQFIIYLTLPILTHYLTQEQFGIVAVSTAFLSLIDILSNIGLPAAVFRFYNDTQVDEERKTITGTSFWLFILIAIVTTIIIYFYADLVSLWLFQTAKYKSIIRLSAFVLSINTFVNFLIILLRLKTRPIIVGFQIILQTIFQIFIGILLITTFHLNVDGY